MCLFAIFSFAISKYGGFTTPLIILYGSEKLLKSWDDNLANESAYAVESVLLPALPALWA